MMYAIRFAHLGSQHSFSVEMTDQEYSNYRRRVARMSDAEHEAHKQEACATRGVSLKPREHIAATVTREFYLRNGRFPTNSELLRHVAS